MLIPSLKTLISTFAETQVDLSKIEVEDEDDGVVYDEDGNIIEEPEEE